MPTASLADIAQIHPSTGGRASLSDIATIHEEASKPTAGAQMAAFGLTPLLVGEADPRIEAVKGAGKEFLSHVGAAADWARAHVPGVAKLDTLVKPRDINLQPSNNGQKAGALLENAVEYSYPLGKISKAVSLASLPARMAAEGAGSAAVTAFQSKGDPTQTAIGGALGAAGPVASLALRAGANAMRSAAAGAKEGGVAGAIAGAIRTAAPVETQQMVVQALKPTARNTGFTKGLGRALPEIKASEAELGKPIENLADFQQAVDLAKKRVWSQYEQIAGPKAQMGVDASPVAKAMAESIPSKVAIQSPGLAKSIVAKADTYRGVYQVQQLEQMLVETNAELESFYAKYPTAQRKVLERDPRIAYKVAEAQGLRNLIYRTLDSAGEGNAARELKQRYGALMNVEHETFRRANVAARQQPESLSEQIGKVRAAADYARGTYKLMTGNLSGAADIAAAKAGRAVSTALKEQQTTDSLIKRAMAKFEGAPTPVPFNPPRIVGYLGPGARPMPPAPDTSFVRGVPAMTEAPNPSRMLPEAQPPRRVFNMPGEVSPTPPDASKVGSMPAAPLDYAIDPTVTVKAGGLRVKQFSGDPRAAAAAVATPEVRSMLERMLEDLNTFTPERGRLVRSEGSAVKDAYVHGVAGSPVGDDIRVISEQNTGNAQIERAIKDLLAGKMPTNRLHTAALDAAMGYLEKRPGYRGPVIPGESVGRAAGSIEDDGFEAFSRAVDDLGKKP